MPVWSRPKTRRALLMECRDKSRSAWLYFPHIELLFLLFAFEGAVASQLGALRNGGCPWVLYMACTALVSRQFPSDSSEVQLIPLLAGPVARGFERFFPT